MKQKKSRSSSITMTSLFKMGRQSFLEMSSMGEHSGSGSKLFEFRAQHSGWLSMKPFYWTYLRVWTRAFFVIKDMFLVWYKRKPKSNFGLKPAGFIPLQGCKVSPEGVDGSGYVFRIIHDQFNGQDLVLKAPTSLEASAWEEMLSECAKICTENARLGVTLLLETETKEQEREKSISVEQARRKAQEAQSLHEEKQKIMENQLKLRRKNKKLLQKNLKLQKNNKMDMSFVKRKIGAQHEELSQKEAKFRELREGFEEAREATEELTRLVLAHEGAQKECILKNLENIAEIFMEECKFVSNDEIQT